MRLEELCQQLSQLRQTLPLGKTLRQGELICHLAGLALDCQGQLRLLALEYDPAYPDWLEQQAPEARRERPEPSTRRQLMLRQDDLPFRRVLEGFPREISFGDLSFRCGEWDNTYGGQGQTALFCRLLDQGWDPGPVGELPLQELCFSRWTLEGQYDRIPAIDPQAPVSFSMQPERKRHPVQLPLTLTVGQGTGKMTFTDQATGETLWMQVLQVRLEDMWAQMEQVFAHHRQQGQLPPEQIDQMQAQFQQDFAQKCPRSMRYPVVEYQCQDDCQLDFYLSRYLDEPPGDGGDSIGFLVRPEQRRTPEGWKIQTAVLQQPVEPDTRLIQAELFCRYVEQPGRVIQTGGDGENVPE